MNQKNDFLAGLLRQGSRAMAGFASRELLEKHPEAREGFEPDPFAGWQNWLMPRVEELAAAIAADRPRLFISQVQWGKAALVARGISPQGFRDALTCLREVVAVELPDQVAPLAAEYVDLALASYDEPSVELSARLLPDTEMGRLATTYLRILLEGDRRQASRLILDALDDGRNARELYLQVLLPAQEEVGQMWLANEINVAEEHFASQTTKMVMAQLLPRATSQPPNGKTMLAAAVAGNQHDIGLQVVADFFDLDGWRTVLLGANVPAHDLVQAVNGFAADLLGISVSQPTQLEAVKATIQAVREDTRSAHVKILLGGRVFSDSDELPREFGADGFAADPEEAVAVGRQLVGLD